MSVNDTDRAARLAEALRTNLRRRKAQARATGPTASNDQTETEIEGGASRRE